MIIKNKEVKEHSTVELTVEVSKEEFETACQKVYKKNVNKITIPGFRKGKASRKMIEKMYGSSFFWEDAVNESYPDIYEAATKEAEIVPVGKADMEVLDISEEGYSFKALVPVKPEVSISDYKGIEAEKPEVSLEASEIDAEIERMRKRNGRIESVDREIQTGDTAVIDYEGFLDGVPFEGGKDENHNLEIGAGQFIPGFEEQLIGAKAGDERDLNLSFPEQYHAENLAGKDVVFKVTVHEVKQTTLPELDDEFAKDVSEFDTLDELRADIEAKLKESKENAANNAFEGSLYEKLAEKLEADIPHAMIHTQLDSMVENFAYRISSQGMEFEQYLQMTGMTLENLQEIYHPQAEQQVKLSLAFEKIAELEKLEASDEDVDAEIKKLAEQYNMPEDQVKILLPADGIKRDITLQKAADLVKDTAVAVAPKAPSEEPKEVETADAE